MSGRRGAQSADYLSLEKRDAHSHASSSGQQQVSCVEKVLGRNVVMKHKKQELNLEALYEEFARSLVTSRTDVEEYGFLKLDSS